MAVYHLRHATIIVLILTIFSDDAHSEIWLPDDLVAEGNIADLSALDTSGGQLPGKYSVTVYLNGEDLGVQSIRFVAAKRSDGKPLAPVGAVQDDTGLVPWLTRRDMVLYGLDLKKYPALPEDKCVVPGAFIPGAFTKFDFARMRLNISIPQAELPGRLRGEISPKRWDNGINAVLLNYNLSGSEQNGHYGRSSDHTLRLDSGLNLGAWRLRDSRIFQYREGPWGRDNSWQHAETYLERAIVPLRSRLTFGDSRTESDLFDSLGVRGITLATDEDMLPETLRGFAPVVRGTAASAAEVIVRQNGYEVYRTQVPPGAFVIRDLWAVGTAGDLEVTVKEADGSRRVFTVPYSSTPVLVREGFKKYSLTAGQLRSSSDRYRKPEFVQGTLKWGLPGGVTIYSGTQLSARYRAVSAGAGLNMANFGAVSADITHAGSELADGGHYHGQAVRFLYSWFLGATDTTFNLVGYRYSTRGFHTLDETALKGMSGWLYDSDKTDENGHPVRRPYTDYYNLNSPRKERLEASISQKVGSAGSLYVSGSRESYWDGRGTTSSWQSGFSGTVGSVSYNLMGHWQKTDVEPRANKSVSLFLSVPLDILLGGNDVARTNNIRANFSINEDNRGSLNQQSGLSGQALEDNQLDWSVMQGYSSYGKEAGNASLGYRGTHGNGNLGYSYGRNYHSISYGLSGGALLHEDVITFGQPLNDGGVLAVAQHAAGTRVNSTTGVKIDRRGFALIPLASPYREVSVSLDVDSLPDDVDSDGATRRVVLTRGAVGRVDFNTKQGLRVLMKLRHNGKPLPFGTTVTGGNNSSITGDNGQVYLSGLAPQGTLKAQWGRTAAEQCTVTYKVPAGATYKVPAGAKDPVVYITENCR